MNIFRMLKGNFPHICIGLLSAFCVRLLGIITIGEILIILYATTRLLFQKFNIFGYNELIYKWTLALLCAIVFSGFNVDFSTNYMKGIMSILLLYFSFQYFAYLLSRGEKYSLIAFLWGYCISNILVNFFFLSFSDLIIGERALAIEEYQEEMYAYIYFPFAYLFNIILYSNYKKTLLLVNFAIALYFLFGGSRNSFLILMLTDIFLLFNYLYSGKLKYVNNKLLLKISFTLLISLYLLNQGYSHLASNGYLGEGPQLKYEIQSAAKGGIASSRSYFIRGLITIAHHPFGAIGFQQYPNDSWEIRQEYAQITNTEMRYSDPNCAAHSAMLDWWIYFGILTIPFWIFVIKQCLLACKSALTSKNAYSALTLVCSFRILWNAFFSPFSDRIMWGFQIIMVIYFLHLSKKEQHGQLFS